MFDFFLLWLDSWEIYLIESTINESMFCEKLFFILFSAPFCPSRFWKDSTPTFWIFLGLVTFLWSLCSICFIIFLFYLNFEVLWKKLCLGLLHLSILLFLLISNIFLPLPKYFGIFWLIIFLYKFNFMYYTFSYYCITPHLQPSSPT